MISRRLHRTLPAFAALSLVCGLIFESRGVWGNDVFGGGKCTIPGTAPGGTTKCTSQNNGWCMIESIAVGNKVGTVNGVCVCYEGYSGTMCQTPTSDLSGGTGRGTTNAVGALALGGIAAYVLSQLAAGASGGVLALG
uniref:Uncharacterized protein LOC111134987 n=1 Tax=Crassostrea virginica TaxID=6565 RepID=A0A8B8EKR3_CRAVI|nr:uncharacterized protein LOC111134987 [Crassostrea virginica]